MNLLRLCPAEYVPILHGKFNLSLNHAHCIVYSCHCDCHVNLIFAGVYSFNMLTEKCCCELLEEVDHFEQWCKDNKLRINRPNTMNRYGAILDDFGFETVLDE